MSTISTKVLLTSAVATSILTLSANSFSLNPAEVKAGPVVLIPKLDVDIENNSNIYKASNDPAASTTGEHDSMIYTFRPELTTQAQNNNDLYYGTIYIDAGIYSDSLEGDDDYVDIGLLLGADMEFNAKNAMFIYADIEKLHDDRGDVFSAGNATLFDAPDEYDSNRLGSTYSFGADDAFFTMDLSLELYQKEYTTNPTLTAIRNYDSTDFDSVFFFQFMPKTDAFFELGYKDINYKEDISPSAGLGAETLDSNETTAYLGMRWEATSNTVGIVKLGVYNKDFSDNNIDDIDHEGAWEVDATYNSSDYASFNLNSASFVEENEGASSAKLSRTLGIAWDHNWAKNISSNVSLDYRKDKHNGNLVFSRVDETNTATVGILYNFRRWFDIGFDYSAESRQSTNTAFEYDQQIVTLSLDFSL